jgi:uncharacterized membrane-anchored protein
MKLLMLDPMNLIIGLVALFGVISFFINQPNYGLIFLIVSTLVEAVSRLAK